MELHFEAQSTTATTYKAPISYSWVRFRDLLLHFPTSNSLKAPYPSPSWPSVPGRSAGSSEPCYHQKSESTTVKLDETLSVSWTCGRCKNRFMYTLWALTDLLLQCHDGLPALQHGDPPVYLLHSEDGSQRVRVLLGEDWTSQYISLTSHIPGSHLWGDDPQPKVAGGPLAPDACRSHRQQCHYPGRPGPQLPGSSSQGYEEDHHYVQSGGGTLRSGQQVSSYRHHFSAYISSLVSIQFLLTEMRENRG